MNFIMSAALRAAGDARTPMWIGVGTNLVSLAGLTCLFLATSACRPRGKGGGGQWFSLRLQG